MGKEKGDWHPHSVQHLCRPRCFGIRQKVKSNNCSSLSLWINHIPERVGHWWKVITARDIKQPFHHILPKKQTPGWAGEENSTTNLLMKTSQMENCQHPFTLLLFLCTLYTCTEQRVCTFLGPILDSAFKAGAFFWRSSKKRGHVFGKQ